MPALNRAYNPDEVEDDGFSLCPDLDAIAQVVNSDYKIIDNEREVLNLDVEVLDGPMAGRHAFPSFWMKHSSDEAVNIADRSLKKLCIAVGHTGALTNSDHLHMKPFRLKVTTKADKKGVDRNNFSFSPINASTSAAPTSAPAQPTASKPWEQARAG